MSAIARRDKNRFAFTLVELLVVIAIISVLAALLLPALEQALLTAKTASCGSNLRQLSIAMTQYTDDNEGYWPYRGREPEDTGASIADVEIWGVDADHRRRQTRITPYIDPGPVYACPVVGLNWSEVWPGKPPHSWHNTAWVWPGYGVFAGHSTHDTTRNPCDPETGNALGGGETNWRKVTPIRVSQYPKRPILGDILYYKRTDGWPHTIHVLNNVQFCYSGSHVQGETVYDPAGGGATVANAPIPPHHFAYSDGSVMGYVGGFVRLMNYIGRNELYWHLKE